MVILRTILGDKRVELQAHPVILPTTTWDGLSVGDQQKLTNDAVKYAVISWDGDSLGLVTPTAEYKSAFAQYQTRVQIDLGIEIPGHGIFGPLHHIGP